MKNFQIYLFSAVPKAYLSIPTTVTNRKITAQFQEIADYNTQNLFLRPIYTQVKSRVRDIFHQLNLYNHILAH